MKKSVITVILVLVTAIVFSACGSNYSGDYWDEASVSGSFDENYTYREIV